MTMPRPFTWTRVLAVPRSMPMSRENSRRDHRTKVGIPLPDAEPTFTRRITSRRAETRASYVRYAASAVIKECGVGVGEGRGVVPVAVPVVPAVLGRGVAVGSGRTVDVGRTVGRTVARTVGRDRRSHRRGRTARRGGPRRRGRRGQTRDDLRVARARETRETDRLVALVVDDHAVDDARRRLLIDPHERVLDVRPRFEEPDVTACAAGRDRS